MRRMSGIAVIFQLLSVYLITISGDEKFCAKDRKLLLGGVFNYDKIIFAYSWKEVNSVQLWLIWRFEAKDQLVPIGKDTSVTEVFPGIPLFRAGFGLTVKCDSGDDKCDSYRQLVFIFFQTSYRVFRYSEDKFGPENDPTKILWGLKPRGEASDWFFGNTGMDNINSIVFMAGYQSQLFVISKSTLYSSPVDIKASTLKWNKLSENKEFTNTLGGFVFGTDLLFNKNEAPDSILLKYDQNGKELEKIPVWKYFGCESAETRAPVGGGGEGAPGDQSAEPGLQNPENPEQQMESRNKRNKSLATIIMVCVLIAIILTNIIAAAFWISVYRRNSSQSNP